MAGIPWRKRKDLEPHVAKAFTRRFINAGVGEPKKKIEALKSDFHCCKIPSWLTIDALECTWDGNRVEFTVVWRVCRDHSVEEVLKFTKSLYEERLTLSELEDAQYEFNDSIVKSPEVLKEITEIENKIVEELTREYLHSMNKLITGDSPVIRLSDLRDLFSVKSNVKFNHGTRFANGYEKKGNGLSRAAVLILASGDVDYMVSLLNSMPNRKHEVTADKIKALMK